MSNENKKALKINVSTIVGLGLLTAVTVVLQVFAVGIRFGMFNITFSLVPIIVGAALYGWKSGAWLGFVFGVAVLLTDAGAFLAVNVPGTIATCILKGALAGLVAGLVYNFISKKNKVAAVMVAGVVSPIVNTGIFLLGCVLFFYDTVAAWGAGMGFESVGAYLIFGMVGVNFLVEAAVNLVLGSAIVLIINQGKKTLAARA